MGGLRRHVPHLRLHVRAKVLHGGLLHPSPAGVRVVHCDHRLRCHCLLLGLRPRRPSSREPCGEDRRQEDRAHRGFAPGGRGRPHLPGPGTLAALPLLGGHSGLRGRRPLCHPNDGPLQVLPPETGEGGGLGQRRRQRGAGDTRPHRGGRHPEIRLEGFYSGLGQCRDRGDLCGGLPVPEGGPGVYGPPRGRGGPRCPLGAPGTRICGARGVSGTPRGPILIDFQAHRSLLLLRRGGASSPYSPSWSPT